MLPDGGSLNLLPEHSQEVSEFMVGTTQLSCKGSVDSGVKRTALCPHGYPAYLWEHQSWWEKDVALHDQDARDVPPGVNSSSPQPPRESGGLWSGTFMDIFDAVKYIISGNTRMEPSFACENYWHTGCQWERQSPSLLLLQLEWTGSVSSGNQTFKLVNKTNWVLCWKQGNSKMMTHFEIL